MCEELGQDTQTGTICNTLTFSKQKNVTHNKKTGGKKISSGAVFVQSKKRKRNRSQGQRVSVANVP